MTATIDPSARSARLCFELLGWWHPGTGRGDGVGADAVVLRDPAGLPYLPGRTVKGLLREAVHLGVAAGLTGLDASVEERLFGTALADKGGDERVRKLEEARFRTHAGCLRFNDAVLGATRTEAAAWRAWAATDDGKVKVRELVSTLASTAIDPASGTVREQTLRTIEVAAPVTLWAPISVEGDAPVPWTSLRDAAALFLRAVGSHRTRGLGRCAVTIVPEVS